MGEVEKQGRGRRECGKLRNGIKKEGRKEWGRNGQRKKEKQGKMGGVKRGDPAEQRAMKSSVEENGSKKCKKEVS